jgi:hypothetical protein
VLNFLKSSQVQVPFVFAIALGLSWWAYFVFHVEPIHSKTSGPLFSLLQSQKLSIWFIAPVQFLLWLGLSFYWNIIMERLEILTRRNYLPFFFFGATSLLFLQQHELDPILWGLLFVLPALDKLIRIPEYTELTQLIFDTCFLLGLAALIHPLYLLLATFLIPAFFYQKIGVIRYYFVGVLALFLPSLLTMGFFYLLDIKFEFILPDLTNFNLSSLKTGLPYLPVLLIFILSIPNFIRNLTVNKMSVRNAWLMIIWFIAISFSASLFDVFAIETGILVASAPLSAILSQSILNERKKRFSGILFLLFIITWIWVSIFEWLFNA